MQAIVALGESGARAEKSGLAQLLFLTLSQVQTYLTNAGWIGPFSPGDNMNAAFVSAFETMTTDSLYDDWAGDLGIFGYTNVPVGEMGLIDSLNAGITVYSFTTPINPNFSDNRSTYLVRATAVPLPAAFWLLSSGLIGLAGIAKRKH